MAYAGFLAHMLAERQELAGLWLSNPHVDHFLYYSLVHGEGASFILTSPTLEMQIPVPLPGLQFALHLLCSRLRLSSHLPASLPIASDLRAGADTPGCPKVCPRLILAMMSNPYNKSQAMLSIVILDEITISIVILC